MSARECYSCGKELAPEEVAVDGGWLCWCEQCAGALIEEQCLWRLSVCFQNQREPKGT
jgi:hypothetical protein